MLLAEHAKNEMLLLSVEQMEQDCKAKDKKISTLKKEIKRFAALCVKKGKSRLTISKLLYNTEDVMTEVNYLEVMQIKK